MIEVVEPGPLTSVQDPFGRRGWRHLGVPAGGAADAWSARLANRLAGNDEGEALLEVTLGGLALRVDRPTVMSLTGGLAATMDGLELPGGEAWIARPGSVIRVEPADGARGYLAVAGGLIVESVLGSPSTDLRSRFGGFEGRALRAGDRLTTGEATGRRGRFAGSRDGGPIRVVEGPHAAGLERLLEAEWTVGVEADRTGVRLDGPRIEGGEVVSIGLPLGAIQVPPDGRPIVMLADRPVTGGYRVPACLIRADVGRVAQLRTGDVVRFASVSVGEAREALEVAEGELAAIETLAASDGDELGWIGSHG